MQRVCLQGFSLGTKSRQKSKHKDAVLLQLFFIQNKDRRASNKKFNAMCFTTFSLRTKSR